MSPTVTTNGVFSVDTSLHTCSKTPGWTLPVRSPRMTNRCPYETAAQRIRNEHARRTPVTVPLWSMRIRIMASRHSAFYSPLLIAVRFLREEGHDAPYAVLAPG